MPLLAKGRTRTNCQYLRLIGSFAKQNKTCRIVVIGNKNGSRARRVQELTKGFFIPLRGKTFAMDFRQQICRG